MSSTSDSRGSSTRLVSDVVERNGTEKPLDPTRFVQVLSNLLQNAAKFTERGGQISVAARLDESTLKVTVRDNGIGEAHSDGPGQGSAFTIHLPLFPLMGLNDQPERTDVAIPLCRFGNGSSSWTTTWMRPKAWLTG